MSALVSHAAPPLSGRIRVPGDKSISHRAVLFGLLSVGETRIDGLLESEDVLAMVAAARAFGAHVSRSTEAGSQAWSVHGVGLGGLDEPDSVLDMGNAGTAARLLIGVAAGQAITTFFTGDASLRRRPMERVLAPLRQMGATFLARTGSRLPLAVTGASTLGPIVYETPMASAQVKSAVVLAGLTAPGETTVVESEPTRDHTERMLGRFGATVSVEPTPSGGRRVTVQGQPELTATDVAVPADPSSAAFPLVAALLVPQSAVTVEHVGTNPLRTGLLTTLAEMGALVSAGGDHDVGGEPQADLTASSSSLVGVSVPPERIPTMIDEIPILAIAAACADGPTYLSGLAELRVKESDRLSAIAAGLSVCGVRVDEGPDSLIIHGTGRPPAGGATVAVHMDHRIAMAFLVLGMVTDAPVAIDDPSAIATSFPDFVALMSGLGAEFRQA